MDKNELDTKLKRIGKSAFARYFNELRQGCKDIMYNEYTRGGVDIRMNQAAHIFAAGQEWEALKIIANSSRVDRAGRNAAQALLRQHSF